MAAPARLPRQAGGLVTAQGLRCKQAGPQRQGGTGRAAQDGPR